MDLPKRKPNRLQGFDYGQNGAYFITICVKDRKKILSKIFVGTGVLDCPKIQLSYHGLIADKYIKQLNDFYDNISVDKYVIMPDHIHLLITISNGQSRTPNGQSRTPNGQSRTPNGQSRTPVPTKDNKNSIIAKFVSTFKRFCNKEYNENIWQSRYYDHIIRNQADYNETWEYIENNPVKWRLT